MRRRYSYFARCTRNGGAIPFERLELRTIFDAGAAADLLTISKHSVSAAIVNGQDAGDLFPSVGIVDGNCSGTLIHPQYVLTAGHCMAGVPASLASFELGNSKHSVEEVHIHPRYDNERFDLGFDLALLKLFDPVEDVEPTPILRSQPQQGELLTLVGFGQTGDVEQGSNFDFGQKQFATTELEQISDIHLSWTLDGPQDGSTAPGDSGGPAFVQRDGEYLVAGITSGGDFFPFSLGSNSFDTRVDLLAPYVDFIIGGGGGEPDEHSDDLGEQATPLDVSGGAVDLRGAWQRLDDNDVFSFALDVNAQVSITSIKSPFGASTAINLFNEQGDPVTSGQGQGESSRAAVLTEGIYYVSLRSTVPGDYAFTLKAVYDDETSLGKHLNLQRGFDIATGRLNFKSQSGGLDGDRDEFRFELSRSTTMELLLTADTPGLDTYLRLYRNDGDLLAFNSGVVPGNRSTSRVRMQLPPGEYRASVGSYLDRSVGDFTFSVSRVLRADSNGDRRVDLLDFAALRAQFNKSGDGLTADFNNDDLVNIVDFELLRQEFGLAAAPPRTAAAGSPPTSLATLGAVELASAAPVAASYANAMAMPGEPSPLLTITEWSGVRARSRRLDRQ